MTSLIEDCQAWINKGQESWKSYFSKWETFAEYEESLPESELIRELSDKPRERRNGSKKPLKLSLARKGLKRVFFKNQQRKQKKIIKKEKSYHKHETETKSIAHKNLVEILENEQLEISLMTISDLLKESTNNYELFAVLFQTFSGRDVTVQDSDSLLSRQQQMLPCSEFERRMANLLFENKRLLSVSMPGNNLSFQNQRLPSVSMTENSLSFRNRRLLSISLPGNTLSPENSGVLSRSKIRDSLNRSICPPRNVYLQSLIENVQESNSEQMQSNLRQGQNPIVRAKNCNNVSRNNFSKLQSSISNGSQTSILENRSNLPYQADLFMIKNTKSVEFDCNHKFPKCFYQNMECLRSQIISELSIMQEDIRLGNLSLQCRTNQMSLSLNNANFITAQKKLSSGHKHLSKTPSRERHSSKKLISDYNESDSDSDDQTKYSSPLIHCQSKRLKADKQVVDGLKLDADDCEHIFDRVMKS